MNAPNRHWPPTREFWLFALVLLTCRIIGCAAAATSGVDAAGRVDMQWEYVESMQTATDGSVAVLMHVRFYNAGDQTKDARPPSKRWMYFSSKAMDVVIEKYMPSKQSSTDNAGRPRLPLLIDESWPSSGDRKRLGRTIPTNINAPEANPADLPASAGTWQEAAKTGIGKKPSWVEEGWIYRNKNKEYALVVMGELDTWDHAVQRTASGGILKSLLIVPAMVFDTLTYPIQMFYAIPAAFYPDQPKKK